MCLLCIGPLESSGGVQGKHLAMIHNGDLLAQLVGLIHVVGGEEDGLPGGVELAQDLPKRQPALRVEPGGGFIEHQDGWAVHDGPCDHEPLCHSSRERPDWCSRTFLEAELDQ